MQLVTATQGMNIKTFGRDCGATFSSLERVTTRLLYLPKPMKVLPFRGDGLLKDAKLPFRNHTACRLDKTNTTKEKKI